MGVANQTKVALHKHDKHDEIFYCIKDEGFGVLEESEIELTIDTEGLFYRNINNVNVIICNS